jgi:GTP-binding protein
MLDTVTIFAAGGEGGSGCVSFRREKYIPRGGPDGGDGGDGGSVRVRATAMINTLGEFRRKRHLSASRGRHGKGKEMQGRRGEDVYLGVPVGTVVWRVGESKREMLADLVSEGEELVVAWGGLGGRGNKAFATATNRTPRLAEKGEIGEETRLLLEVKLLADVGIVGKPSAGKSTFLSSVTSARPKIAEYPFTTLEPVLGVAQTITHELVLLEIPGLIKGAHEGHGLGLEFLRHIERTRAFIHVIDGCSDDPLSDFVEVRSEVKQYKPELLERPVIVAINKIDVKEARDKVVRIKNSLEEQGFVAYAISAATGEGVEELIRETMQTLDREKVAPQTGENKQENIRKPHSTRVRVYRDNEIIIVECYQAERIVAGSDLGDSRVLIQLRRELRELGVLKKLENAGVRHGDTIRIGNVEMEWD